MGTLRSQTQSCDTWKKDKKLGIPWKCHVRSTRKSSAPLLMSAYCQLMDTEPFLLKGVLRRKRLMGSS